MLWVTISLLLLGLGVLTVLWLRSGDNEKLVQSKEPIDTLKEEAIPPPPPPKPKEVFYKLNTHPVRRLLFPKNTFNHDSANVYRNIIVKTGWSVDESFHSLIAHFILLCENDYLYVVPKRPKANYLSINNVTKEKQKVCRAVPLLLAAKVVTESIVYDTDYKKNERKELVIAAFITLFKKAEHLFYGAVEVDEALEEILSQCNQETSLNGWMNSINPAFVEEEILYSRTCNCIFQLNREIYHFPIHELPPKKMISMGDYNF